MAVELAEVLRRFGPAYLQQHTLGREQARAWRAIVACRTPALGGAQLCCDACGALGWRWHSCRNRNCPRCGTRRREAWRAARMAELLDVPYAHLVFTLPHELDALAAVHARWVCDTLLQCTAATLAAFAADPAWLGGQGSFTLVLHTWRQDLRRHLHAHALMACGALGRDAQGAPAWIEPKRASHFLFPVHALSKVFKGKFLDALAKAEADGTLARDPAAVDPARRGERKRALARHDWVVYAKAALAGPAAVLDYLSRYTNRTAIGAERLLAIRGDEVLLRVRGVDAGGEGGEGGDRGKHSAEHGGKRGGKPRAKRVVAIDGVDFVGRFLQHVLPSGSSASATTGCWPRRPRPSGWRPRARCWRCRRPTRARSRTRAPSCSAWRRSTSSAARIARPAAGAACKACRPTAPRWRRSQPAAEGRRDGDGGSPIHRDDATRDAARGLL